MAPDGEVGMARALATRPAQAALLLRHHPWWTPGLLETAVEIAVHSGDKRLAATLAGAASCFRHVTGNSRPAQHNGWYNAVVGSLSETMGEQYPIIFAHGESVSARQALELVVRSFAEGPGPQTRV